MLNTLNFPRNLITWEELAADWWTWGGFGLVWAAWSKWYWAGLRDERRGILWAVLKGREIERRFVWSVYIDGLYKEVSRLHMDEFWQDNS